MTDTVNVDELSLETKGTQGQKILVAILLIIPMFVFAVTPFYNFSAPRLFGLTFYYWFETVWLVVSAVFFLAAAMLLNRMEAAKR